MTPARKNAGNGAGITLMSWQPSQPTASILSNPPALSYKEGVLLGNHSLFLCLDFAIGQGDWDKTLYPNFTYHE